MGQITLELNEYHELTNKIADADARTAALQRELEAERARSFNERLAEISLAWNAAKEIIDYAVGNLSPEFSRNWPHEALKVVADHVATLPGTSSRDGERALIWRDFHASILEFETAASASKISEMRTAEQQLSVAAVLQDRGIEQTIGPTSIYDGFARAMQQAADDQDRLFTRTMIIVIGVVVALVLGLALVFLAL